MNLTSLYTRIRDSQTFTSLMSVRVQLIYKIYMHTTSEDMPMANNLLRLIYMFHQVILHQLIDNWTSVSKPETEVTYNIIESCI